ncbi:MAG: hypothetical protein ABSA18_04640 [Dehalococcoidia bacterium]|jgi:CO dehydrogenase/acetyl-CoA synthase beta subunit
MAVFDLYINKISAYVDDLESKGRRVKKIESAFMAGQVKDLMPFLQGTESISETILRGDTFLELGNPVTSSCAFVLWTQNSGLIKDGRVTLIGPDIQESAGQNLPFGQVLMLGGEELDEKEHESLELSSHIGNKIKGYMVRSMRQNLWARVSNKAAQNGFCFEVLGEALIAIYKSDHPKIKAMEAVFVTSNEADVRLLENIAAQVEKVNKEINKTNWQIKGYDIECALDCSTCSDKPVCDNIKEVLREKSRK